MRREEYTSNAAVHFVPYSWFYRPGAAICLLTGGALLVGSALVLLGIGS